jgi:hypothetical protein
LAPAASPHHNRSSQKVRTTKVEANNQRQAYQSFGQKSRKLIAAGRNGRRDEATTNLNLAEEPEFFAVSEGFGDLRTSLK